MSKNLVFYFSGVHGSGKTTLCKHLQNDNVLLCKRNYQILEEIPFRRAFHRLLNYYAESFFHSTLEEKNSKILIADRCIFDTLIYVDTYYELEMITLKEKNMIYSLFYKLFKGKLLPSMIIFLSPSLEVVRDNLNKDIKVKRRWGFENEIFLKLLYNNYNLFYKENDYSINLLKLSKSDLEFNKNKVLHFINENQVQRK